MNVTVNRESLEVGDPNPTIRILLAERGIPEKAIVVAVNGDVVRQSEWGIHGIEEGDEVEILISAQTPKPRSPVAGCSRG